MQRSSRLPTFIAKLTVAEIESGTTGKMGEVYFPGISFFSPNGPHVDLPARPKVKMELVGKYYKLANTVS